METGVDDLGRSLGAWLSGLMWAVAIAAILVVVLGTLLGLSLTGVI